MAAMSPVGAVSDPPAAANRPGTDGSRARDRQLRVVMLVRNPFTHDSRVEKEAGTLLGVGYDVTVVCEWRPGLPMREVRDGVAIRRVRRPFAGIRLLRFIAYGRAISRALDAARPDILHAHDANALAEVGPVAARLGVPFVYDSHELWSQRTRHKHSRLYHLLNRAWHARVERRWVPRAAAVVTVSPAIARYLADRFGIDRVHFVPNVPPMESPERRLELRHLPGAETIPDDAPILLHIGLYVNDRGIEQVMDALRSLPGLHFVLLGAGDRADLARRQALALGVHDRVHPLARVPASDVVAYARSATIAAVPVIGNALSYTWALPNKLFQSMAAGLPVVASDLPEIGAVVRDADAGLLVDSRRPEAIAAAVRRLLDDASLRARMGENGRRAVADRYNWGVAGRALLDAYATIPVSRPTPSAGRG